MSFSVTVLGSGSAVPTSRRGLTSQYILCRGRHILIDCGEGTQMRIRKYGVKFQRIEHILISHLHGDHYFGLVGLLSTMHLMGRRKQIQIHGPKGLKEIVEMQLNYEGARLAFEVSFNVLDSKTVGVVFEDEKISIQHFPLAHRIPTAGFVIREKLAERHLKAELAQQDGVKIAYFHRLKKGEDVIDEDGSLISFDTKYSEAIIPSIQGVDLLYHEATFIEQHLDRAKATMHTTASQAATIAQKASVGKLIMGHLSARYDSVEQHVEEAKVIFENSEVAEDGETYLL